MSNRIVPVLVAALLVASLAGPIGTQPAAAATVGDVTIKEDCGTVAKFAFPRACHAATMTFGSIDETQEDSEIEVDVHVGTQSVYESWRSHQTVQDNYLEDTRTLASLEARDAIATAYENGESATAAQAAGQQAINDYYATHQKNLYEIAGQHTARIVYLDNVTKQHSNIDNNFITPSLPDWQGSGDITQANIKDTATENVTLVNGSTTEVTVPSIRWKAEFTGGPAYHTNTKLYDHWRSDQGLFYLPDPSTNDNRMLWDGKKTLMNAPAAGLESQLGYDYSRISELQDRIRTQANTTVNNYDSGVAEDLYAAMDSGELDPADVRGAEGMVRYMSGAGDGDTNVTADRFNYALRSTLDLASGDLESTMEVQFDGATERNYDAVNDTYTYNSVSKTYKGLLFSSEVPSGGFETGASYNVSNLTGTQTMVYDGGASDVTFWKGNMTIVSITDQNGDPVENVSWEKPSYATYNASEYISALEKASQQRSIIVQEDSDTTLTFPSFSDGDGGLFGWLSDLLGIGDLSWLNDSIAGIPMWGWIGGVAFVLSRGEG